MAGIIELARRSGVVLALGYMFGQGVTFASQLTIKQFSSPELLGIAVLLISLFSFAFQFNDFGNTTLATKTANEKDWEKLFGFITVRAIFGITVSLGLVMHAISVQTVNLDRVLLITIPLLAGASGLMMTGAVEQTGNYVRLAFLQNFPWLTNGFAILTILFLPQYQTAIQIIWISSIFLVLIVSWRGFGEFKFAFKRIEYLSAFGLVLAHIGPPLLGQVLGRFVLLTIAQYGGLALVGTYGLIKYGQIGSSLLLSFWIRPIHRKLTVAAVNLNESYWNIILKYKWPLVASLVISVIALISFRLPNITIDKDIQHWSLVFVVLPFWVLSGISSQSIARLGKAKRFTLIELFGLAINLIVFLVFVRVDTVYAVICGEIFQYIFISLCFYTIRRRLPEGNI